MEPARAPLHGIRMVSKMHHARRPDELPERAAKSSIVRARPQAIWPTIQTRLRLDRPDVPAPQGKRELGVLAKRAFVAITTSDARHHQPSDPPAVPARSAGETSVESADAELDASKSRE